MNNGWFEFAWPGRGMAWAMVAFVTLAGLGCRRPPPAVAVGVPTGPAPLSLPTITNSMGMKMVELPAGQFRTGAQGTGSRVVTLTQPFLVGATEVTRAEYAAVMGLPKPADSDCNLPVVGVTWDDAGAFCTKLSEKDGRAYDLPSEAQWEYACQGGLFAPFDPALADVGDAMWYNLNSGLHAHPAGTRVPNRWGLFDMHGNVREWCRDYWDFNPPAGVDPLGKYTGAVGFEPGGQRVRRGGAFDTPGSSCSCGARDGAPPNLSWPDLGFRVIVELPTKPVDGGAKDR